MTTQFYVDASGQFLGGFGDGAKPPSGATEVTTAPPSGDYTWSGKKWVAPTPTLADQAAAAIASGLAITSTATPALDGTYACDDAAQARINRVSVYLQVNGSFPGGASTIVWVDATGAQHTFTEAQFKTFTAAIGTYVAALDDVILGIITTMPSATATIA
jgi:hypothetical protein